MPVRWYICPYDTVPHGPHIGRRCAMHRHIPVVPNATGARWRELEILGNHCLVKVDASLATITVIDADPDFREIPTGTTVPPARRAAVQTKLEALGYTAAEITGTGWAVAALRTLLASVRHIVTERPDHSGFQITPIRRAPPGSLAELNRDIPG